MPFSPVQWQDTELTLSNLLKFWLSLTHIPLKVSAPAPQWHLAVLCQLPSLTQTEEQLLL